MLTWLLVIAILLLVAGAVGGVFWYFGWSGVFSFTAVSGETADQKKLRYERTYGELVAILGIALGLISLGASLFIKSSVQTPEPSS